MPRWTEQPSFAQVRDFKKFVKTSDFVSLLPPGTATIYKSLRKGAVIDADGYEW